MGVPGCLSPHLGAAQSGVQQDQVFARFQRFHLLNKNHATLAVFGPTWWQQLWLLGNPNRVMEVPNSAKGESHAPLWDVTCERQSEKHQMASCVVR